MFPFICRILCERTFDWGIDSHTNDVTCVILVSRCSMITFLEADSFSPCATPLYGFNIAFTLDY